MYHFDYVSKGQAAPVKKELISIIHAAQDILRHEFTFRYDFVGSSKRNMITQDVKSNIGFDFDVNIEINDEEQDYSPAQIRYKLKAAFDSIATRFGYSHAEDSTRVLTIKFKDATHSRIKHSCDIAIVNNYIDDDGYERQEYIRFNKKTVNILGKNNRTDIICCPKKPSGSRIMVTGVDCENYTYSRRIQTQISTNIPVPCMPKQYMKYAKSMATIIATKGGMPHAPSLYYLPHDHLP